MATTRRTVKFQSLIKSMKPPYTTEELPIDIKRDAIFDRKINVLSFLIENQIPEDVAASAYELMQIGLLRNNDSDEPISELKYFRRAQTIRDEAGLYRKPDQLLFNSMKDIDELEEQLRHGNPVKLMYQILKLTEMHNLTEIVFHHQNWISRLSSNVQFGLRVLFILHRHLSYPYLSDFRDKLIDSMYTEEDFMFSLNIKTPYMGSDGDIERVIERIMRVSDDVLSAPVAISLLKCILSAKLGPTHITLLLIQYLPKILNSGVKLNITIAHADVISIKFIEKLGIIEKGSPEDVCFVKEWLDEIKLKRESATLLYYALYNMSECMNPRTLLRQSDYDISKDICCPLDVPQELWEKCFDPKQKSPPRLLCLAANNIGWALNSSICPPGLNLEMFIETHMFRSKRTRLFKLSREMS